MNRPSTAGRTAGILDQSGSGPIQTSSSITHIGSIPDDGGSWTARTAPDARVSVLTVTVWKRGYRIEPQSPPQRVR
jgi:hypothetical protein